MRDYLTGLGVTQLGLVIASHNHADHIGGLAEVVRRYRPQFYMDNGVPATTQTYARMLDAVSAVGSQIVEPTSRQVTPGEASLTVVPPPGIPDWDQNDNSIGIVLRDGEFFLTLTGDAEQREWSWWLTHQRAAFREVQVHKASHHGSNNGDTRDGLALLSPERVAIGAGAGNASARTFPCVEFSRYAPARQLRRIRGDQPVLSEVPKRNTDAAEAPARSADR